MVLCSEKQVKVLEIQDKMNQKLLSPAMARTSYIQSNDDDYDNASFALDQYTDLDLSSASPNKMHASLTHYPNSGLCSSS